MLELGELIIYWKERQWAHPPIAHHPWPYVVQSTIYYLDCLSKLHQETNQQKEAVSHAISPKENP